MFSCIFLFSPRSCIDNGRVGPLCDIFSSTSQRFPMVWTLWWPIHRPFHTEILHYRCHEGLPFTLPLFVHTEPSGTGLKPLQCVNSYRMLVLRNQKRCDYPHHDFEICVFFFTRFPWFLLNMHRSTVNHTDAVITCCDWDPDPPMYYGK